MHDKSRSKLSIVLVKMIKKSRFGSITINSKNLKGFKCDGEFIEFRTQSSLEKASQITLWN